MDLNFDITAYLRLSVTDIVIVCISTFLIVLIAKHFFWDKVQAYLDARKHAIQADIDAGIEEREAGNAYKAQYEAQLATAKGEAHALMEQAKATAQAEKKEILNAAKVEAENLKAKARQDIEREKTAAREEMKDAIVSVAFEAAKQVVHKEIDEQTHKQYVDAFIEQAGDDTWQTS